MEAQLEFDALVSEFAQLSAQVKQQISAVDGQRQAKAFSTAESLDVGKSVENQVQEPRFGNLSHANAQRSNAAQFSPVQKQRPGVREPMRDDLREAAQEADDIDEISKFTQLMQKYERLGREGGQTAESGKLEAAKERFEAKDVQPKQESVQSPVQIVQQAHEQLFEQQPVLDNKETEISNYEPDDYNLDAASMETKPELAVDYGDKESASTKQVTAVRVVSQQYVEPLLDEGKNEAQELQPRTETVKVANSGSQNAELQLLLSRIAENEAFLRQNGLDGQFGAVEARNGDFGGQDALEQQQEQKIADLGRNSQQTTEQAPSNAVQAQVSAYSELSDEAEVPCLIARSQQRGVVSSPRRAVESGNGVENQTENENQAKSNENESFEGNESEAFKNNASGQEGQQSNKDGSQLQSITRNPTISAFSYDLIAFPPENPSESDITAFKSSLSALLASGEPAGEVSAEVVQLLSAAAHDLPTPPGLYQLVQSTSPNTTFSALRKRFLAATASVPKTELSFALISSLIEENELQDGAPADALADVFLAYSQITGYQQIVSRQLFESSQHELARFFSKHCPKLALGSTMGLEQAQAFFKDLNLQTILPLGRAAVCFTRAAYCQARYIADYAAVNSAKSVPNLQRRESLNFDFLTYLNQSVLGDVGQTKPMRAQGCRLCFFGFLCFVYLLSEAVHAELCDYAAGGGNQQLVKQESDINVQTGGFQEDLRQSKPANQDQLGDQASISVSQQYQPLKQLKTASQASNRLPAATQATKSALTASISTKKTQFSQPLFASSQAPLTTSNFSLFAAWRGLLRFGLFIDQAVLGRARRAGYLEFSRAFCRGIQGQDAGGAYNNYYCQPALKNQFFTNANFQGLKNPSQYCSPGTQQYASPLPQFLPAPARVLLRRYEPRLRALFQRICGQTADLNSINQLLHQQLIFKLLPAGYFQGFVLLNYSQLSSQFAPVLTYQETVCLIAAAAERALAAGVYAQYFTSAEERLAYALRELLGGAR